MGDGSWQFRTTRGTVTVGSDAITIRATPRAFLAGQRARWRDGTDRERAKSLFAVVGVLAWAVLVVTNVGSLLDIGTVTAAIAAGLSIATGVLGLWVTLLRTATIPRSTVESVSIDPADRTLTIVHEPTGRLAALSRWLWGRSTPLSDGQWRWTTTLPTDENVREARDSFRLRGIALDPPENGTGTETSYRVDVESGVCFCENCGSQVSPADSDCPSCGYALHVEEETRPDSTASATD